MVSGTSGAAWQPLEQELSAWQARGQTVTFWWRDDDATEVTPALDRLLTLASNHGLPLALAVIPDLATRSLAGHLAKHLMNAGTTVATLQHGFAHRNHAPDGEKKCELGHHRPAEIVLEELARGCEQMAALFQGTALPILVPPWNRIDDALVPSLRGLGFEGLSAYGPRGGTEAAPGLVQVNSHIDILRWKGTRGFLGESDIIALLTDHLAARRAGAADPAADLLNSIDTGEPCGLLTHHLDHDQEAWEFLNRFLSFLGNHPAVRFAGAAEAFTLASKEPPPIDSAQENGGPP